MLSIQYLPINYLHSPVLNHRTLVVGGLEFSNVLAHNLQFELHKLHPGFGFGKSGPQKMKSSPSNCVGIPCKPVIQGMQLHYLKTQLQTHHLTSRPLRTPAYSG